MQCFLSFKFNDSHKQVNMFEFKKDLNTTKVEIIYLCSPTLIIHSNISLD